MNGAPRDAPGQGVASLRLLLGQRWGGWAGISEGDSRPIHTGWLRCRAARGELRSLAAQTQDAKAARRMLAIGLVLEGWSREAAAEACAMDRQTLRDWGVFFFFFFVFFFFFFFFLPPRYKKKRVPWDLPPPPEGLSSLSPSPRPAKTGPTAALLTAPQRTSRPVGWEWGWRARVAVFRDLERGRCGGGVVRGGAVARCTCVSGANLGMAFAGSSLR